MCSLNPGCVALAALLWKKRTGAHYVIHSAHPFCRVNLQLVLIYLAPRGGSRPAAVIQSVESQLSDLAGRWSASEPIHLHFSCKKALILYVICSLSDISSEWNRSGPCLRWGPSPCVINAHCVKHYQPTFASYIRTWPVARHHLPECSSTLAVEQICVWPDTCGVFWLQRPLITSEHESGLLFHLRMWE